MEKGDLAFGVGLRRPHFDGILEGLPVSSAEIPVARFRGEHPALQRRWVRTWLRGHVLARPGARQVAPSSARPPPGSLSRRSARFVRVLDTEVGRTPYRQAGPEQDAASPSAACAGPQYLTPSANA